MVNKGVKEFKMPARELSIPVCALANRKAGKPLPITPTSKNSFHSLQAILLILSKAIGLNTRKAMEIRKAPTSALEKYSRPRFIKINELPQMSAKPIRMLQAMRSLRRFEFSMIFGVKVITNPFDHEFYQVINIFICIFV
jgi:hypothetical protein